MKKFILSVILTVSCFSVFAVGTVNIFCKTNSCNTVVNAGYDFLVHSFRNTELWFEPRIGINCILDNTDKAYGIDGGFSISNVYYTNGFFYGLDFDITRATFEDDAIVAGFSAGAKVGIKMYNFKLFGGIEKGFYKCTEGDNRIEGTKKPLMFALGTEIFF